MFYIQDKKCECAACKHKWTALFPYGFNVEYFADNYWDIECPRCGVCCAEVEVK